MLHDVGNPGRMLLAQVGASFRLVVEDALSITGRGTLVIGTVESGSVQTGDRIRILVPGEEHVKHETVVVGVEHDRSVVREANAGERVGLLLRGIALADVEAGGDVVVGVPGNPEPPPEREINVILQAVGDNEKAVVSRVSALTGLGVGEALELMDQAPVLIAEALTPNEASVAAAELLGAGAEILLQPAQPKAVVDLILQAVGENPIDVIREVRALTGSGLKEAHDLVNQAPVMLAEGLSSTEARVAAARLRGAGAQVRLEVRR